jgi:two-component system nitrogen regulation sensor histidine kinase NtrY
MISRSLYLNIVAKVMVIVLLSAIAGYLAASGQSFRIILLSALAIIITTISLVNYLNTTNRHIRFFFDSIRNDDSTLYFPTGRQNKTFSELHASLNKVNQQIKELKLANSSQEQFFQILMEEIATGVITYDDKGFIVHANSSAKKLLSVNVLTHLRQIEQSDPELYQVIMNLKPPERRLVTATGPGGRIQLALKSASFRTNETDMIILSIEDIRNELDEQELRSWMKLIRVLTHEIMNTITPITSLSESLSNIYSRDGQQVSPDEINASKISVTLQGLNVIKEQGRGLRSFVESYRKLTRIPEPDRKIFRVEELFDRVKVLFGSMVEDERCMLMISIPDPGLELYADQNLIMQVLINLMKNAIEANESNPDAVVKIAAGSDSNNHPEICVTDNGPGIPEENLDEIFVPFFTTRSSGSGIGLSISRQIMRIHGGNLKVRSVPGKETTFCLSF